MSEFIRGFPVTIIDCTAAIRADLIGRLFLFFQIIVQMAHTGHDPVIKCITYKNRMILNLIIRFMISNGNIETFGYNCSILCVIKMRMRLDVSNRISYTCSLLSVRKARKSTSLNFRQAILLLRICESLYHEAHISREIS